MRGWVNPIRAIAYRFEVFNQTYAVSTPSILGVVTQNYEERNTRVNAINQIRGHIKNKLRR